MQLRRGKHTPSVFLPFGRGCNSETVAFDGASSLRLHHYLLLRIWSVHHDRWSFITCFFSILWVLIHFLDISRNTAKYAVRRSRSTLSVSQILLLLIECCPLPLLRRRWLFLTNFRTLGHADRLWGIYLPWISVHLYRVGWRCYLKISLATISLTLCHLHETINVNVFLEWRERRNVRFWLIFLDIRFFIKSTGVLVRTVQIN